MEIIAGLLVAGGCWGEWYLFKNPADERNESAKLLHHSKEVRCIIAVAIGITVEFAALAHSIPEAVRLENAVADANVKAEGFRLKADELEAQLRKVDPLKKPITFLSATANVLLSNPNVSPAGWYSQIPIYPIDSVSLDLGKISTGGGWMALLSCKHFERGMQGTNFLLEMEFGTGSFVPEKEFLTSNTVESVAAWDKCLLKIDDLCNDNAVTLMGGSVIVTANSTQYEFSLPIQTNVNILLPAHCYVRSADTHEKDDAVK